MTSGRSGKKAIRRKPSASHWVQYMPFDRYSPSSAVLSAGRLRLSTTSSKRSPTSGIVSDSPSSA